MKNYQQLLLAIGKRRGIEKIIRDLDSSIRSGNLPHSLYLFNELEIAAGSSHPDFHVYEKELAKAYNEYLKIQGGSHNSRPTDKGASDYSDIAAFKNRHWGKRCFILGTGPSLGTVNLEPIANEISFGMNLLCRDFSKLGFTPTYYVAEDEKIIRNSGEILANLSGTQVFLPDFARRWLPDKSSAIYLNYLSQDNNSFEIPFFSTDAARRVWGYGSAAFMAMQLAFYMGFSEVYLLGFDHQYVLPKNARIKGESVIYDDADPNHFETAAFDKGLEWNLPQPEKHVPAYERAAYVFKRNERELVNCTPKTRLRVIPYHTIKWVLNREKPAAPAYSPGKEQEITVVVPCYNVQDTLDMCVESLLSQHCHAKILLINDGSTDATLELAKKWAEKHGNIKVISQTNQGLGSARNTGLAYADSPYITFVDSDDSLEPGILEKSLSKIGEEKADILQFGTRRINRGQIVFTTSQYANFTGLYAIERMIDAYSLAAWSRIYRTDFIQKKRLFFSTKRLHEDVIFTLKAYYYASKTTYLPEAGYNWFVRDKSLTSSVKKIHLTGIMDNIEDFRYFLLKEHLFHDHHYLFIKFIYQMYRMILNNVLLSASYEMKENWLQLLDDFMSRYDFDWQGHNSFIKNSYKNEIHKMFLKLLEPANFKKAQKHNLIF